MATARTLRQTYNEKPNQRHGGVKAVTRQCAPLKKPSKDGNQTQNAHQQKTAATHAGKQPPKLVSVATRAGDIQQ